MDMILQSNNMKVLP